MGSNVEDHVGMGLPLLGRSPWAYGLVGAWGLNLEAHVGVGRVRKISVGPTFCGVQSRSSCWSGTVGLLGLGRSMWALPSCGVQFRSPCWSGITRVRKISVDLMVLWDPI